jgi:hypothetical protein
VIECEKLFFAVNGNGIHAIALVELRHFTQQVTVHVIALRFLSRQPTLPANTAFEIALTDGFVIGMGSEKSA